MASPQGLPGDLYDARLGWADSAAFLERSDGDRHQFRFIVSAEDAIEYENLKHFTRRLLNQAERDETRDQRAACDRQFRRQ
jgi:type IV secretory pathway VirD2 relaxase